MFAVEMYGINKSFGGSKKANDSVNFIKNLFRFEYVLAERCWSQSRVCLKKKILVMEKLAIKKRSRAQF